MRLRSSLAANAISRAADPVKARIVWSDPQPTIGARTRLYTSNSIPPVTSTAPWESKAVPLVLVSVVLRDQSECPGSHHDTDRRVDEEDPSPARPLRDHTAEEDAGRGGYAADGSPEPRVPCCGPCLRESWS